MFLNTDLTFRFGFSAIFDQPIPCVTDDVADGAPWKKWRKSNKFIPQKAVLKTELVVRSSSLEIRGESRIRNLDRQKLSDHLTHILQ